MTRAVVLLSGGLDSATALAIARARGDECYTVAFDYGQRHRAELTAARLGLVAAVRTVVANGLALLGMSAPERM